MNQQANTLPALDLQRAIYVESLVALIDRRLNGAEPAPYPAQRLLTQLLDAGVMTLTRGLTLGQAVEIGAFGISIPVATENSAEALLGIWTRAATDRIACGQIRK